MLRSSNQKHTRPPNRAFVLMQSTLCASCKGWDPYHNQCLASPLTLPHRPVIPRDVQRTSRGICSSPYSIFSFPVSSRFRHRPSFQISNFKFEISLLVPLTPVLPIPSYSPITVPKNSPLSIRRVLCLVPFLSLFSPFSFPTSPPPRASVSRVIYVTHSLDAAARHRNAAQSGVKRKA